MAIASILWRCLDTPGHDACRLVRLDAGWAIEGTAVFHEAGAPARLDYRITCDLAWRTQRGQVEGWIGARSVKHTIIRTGEGEWTLDGRPVPDLGHCVDLDLGFTPATNLLPLRRLALAEGQAADAPAAWLDVSAGTLDLLFQRYERRAAAAYWYESPRSGYAALLEVAASGFILRYPDLWEAEP